jgi:hypothetical protein
VRAVLSTRTGVCAFSLILLASYFVAYEITYEASLAHCQLLRMSYDVPIGDYDLAQLETVPSCGYDRRVLQHIGKNTYTSKIVGPCILWLRATVFSMLVT